MAYPPAAAPPVAAAAPQPPQPAGQPPQHPFPPKPAAPPAPAPMAPAAAPAPAPAPAPPQPLAAPPQDPTETAIERHMGPLRSEIAARFQQLESMVATLAQKPGEGPQEVAMRQQAAAFEAAASQKRVSAIEAAEAANAARARLVSLRAEGLTDPGLSGGFTDTADGTETADSESNKAVVDQLESEAKEKQSIAEQLECEATELAAAAGVLYAKAYGIYPLIQAMAQMTTDEGVKTRKLITDLGAAVGKVTKLVTDGGVGSAPGQGGKAEGIKIPSKSVSAGAGAEPHRRTFSMSAESERFMGLKFPELQGEGAVSEAAFDEAARSAQLAPAQSIAMKHELFSIGRLRR